MISQTLWELISKTTQLEGLLPNTYSPICLFSSSTAGSCIKHIRYGETQTSSLQGLKSQ